MSAQDILDGVLFEIGLNFNNPQLGGNDYSIKQIGYFINEAGRDVSARTEWGKLFKTLNIGGGVSQIGLPIDFKEIAQSSAVCLNKEEFTPVRPVIEPELWELLSKQPSSQNYYHLSEGMINFSPALDNDGASFRYLSSQWVEGKDKITENGDNIYLPERLLVKGAVWRWKRHKGMVFDDIHAEYEADILTEIKADRGVA